MKWLIPGILLSSLFVSLATAATSSSFRDSKSIGYPHTMQAPYADSSLDQKPVNQYPELKVEGYRIESGAINAVNIQARRHNDCNCYPQDFTISDAWVSLQTDEDFDGFYRQFKLVFDADVYSGNARVYADIYLSFEGGPWNLVYTTNRFSLTGNSPLDEYVVETVLDSGYPTGYYDVLIELHDANSGYSLFDYGPYQNPDLSTLPMEDRYNDHIMSSGNSYEFYGSGAFGWISFLLLTSLHLLRKTSIVKPV